MKNMTVQEYASKIGVATSISITHIRLDFLPSNHKVSSHEITSNSSDVLDDRRNPLLRTYIPLIFF